MPKKLHEFSDRKLTIRNYNQSTDGSTDGTYSTFYAIALIDEQSGISDYVLSTIDDGKVACFKEKTQAEAYAQSLNGGTNSASTVSQTLAPLNAPALTRATSEYQVVTFENGHVYYRVNIAHTEKDPSDSSKTKQVYKVLRNKFYKISIDDIQGLGSYSSALLRPTDPETPLNLTPGTWINATFTVAPWDDIEQSAVLK